jgi:4-diphosphocytidyl-2-C-methyl-D-erythritol kinase
MDLHGQKLKEEVPFPLPHMQIEQHADQVQVWAPAKVNLYLEVLAKRGDGYHELETVMLAVRLYDTLTFGEEPSGKIVLQCTDPTLSSGADNLIVRAAMLLRDHTGVARGARVRLTKRIPMAAGLAGGSSNAAATLIALNRLWRLGLARQELCKLGKMLGSDVAFFFSLPAAFATGRGEVVTPQPLGMTLWLVLSSPPAGLSTAAVYGALRVPDQPRSSQEIRLALEQGDVEWTGSLLHNRLQEPARQLCPDLASQFECLARLQPAGHLLSGSGSTMFALCRDHREALRIAHHLRHDPDVLPGSRVFVVRSCS